MYLFNIVLFLIKLPIIIHINLPGIINNFRKKYKRNVYSVGKYNIKWVKWSMKMHLIQLKICE